MDQAPADLGGQCVSSSWGLVAHWSLDEGEGIQVHDDSGNGYDGTLKDGPSWTKGLFGSALQFGMIGSRVEGMISGFGDASITGSAWTNSSTDTTTGEQHRVTGVGFPNGTYFFLTYNGGQPRLEAKSASDQYWDCGTMNLALADGKWHHLAFIIDRTRNESRFYVDGVMLGRCPRTSPADPFGTVGSETNTFIIGAQENTANLSYVGTVDEVKLWARALEDAEMRALARPPM